MLYNLLQTCGKGDSVKTISMFVLGGDEWKQLAERLDMSYDEIRFLDRRTNNPCDVVLDLIGNYRYLSAGEIYDKLVECDLAGAADVL